MYFLGFPYREVTAFSASRGIYRARAPLDSPLLRGKDSLRGFLQNRLSYTSSPTVGGFFFTPDLPAVNPSHA